MLRFPVKISSHKIALQGEWEEPYEGKIGYVVCVGTGSHLVAFKDDPYLPFNPNKFHVDQLIPIASKANPTGEHETLAKQLRAESEWTKKFVALKSKWSWWNDGFHAKTFGAELIKTQGAENGWKNAIRLSKELSSTLYQCLAANKVQIINNELEVFGTEEEKLVDAFGYLPTGVPKKCENVARALFQQLLTRAYEEFPQTFRPDELDFAKKSGLENPESIIERAVFSRGKWTMAPPLEATRMLEKMFEEQNEKAAK
jgi:hypothetical protein